MTSYNLNQLRNGLKLLIVGDPNVILDCDFVKPGKGQAFTRIRIKNLLTGRVLERSIKSSEMVEGADVVDASMQYLYSDGTTWNFMNQQSYEQIEASKSAVGDAAQWIKEQDECLVTLWNGQPILVSAPTFVELRVTGTDPGIKGDTASGGSKPATLETGAVVRVPLFIDIGEVLKIDTRIGEYVSRVKG